MKGKLLRCWHDMLKVDVGRRPEESNNRWVLDKAIIADPLIFSLL
jgi:hypothetical protein